MRDAAVGRVAQHWRGSGGAHGGDGGDAGNFKNISGCSGGDHYDNMYSPTSMGSGGGGHKGGPGGGVVHLRASELLTVMNGRVEADGADAEPMISQGITAGAEGGSGGGSGGSVLLEVGTITMQGQGAISANGGKRGIPGRRRRRWRPGPAAGLSATTAWPRIRRSHSHIDHEQRRERRCRRQRHDRCGRQ